MNKRSGKNKVSQRIKAVMSTPVQPSVDSIPLKPTEKISVLAKNVTAKNVNAAFLGSYSYFQPGRANQYDLGTDNFNGLTDIPMYIALMNEKNGGVLYFPTNLKQKYQFYRYFYRTDAYVGSAIDLLTDLPMSKLALKMPPMQNTKRKNLIKKKYEHMCEKIDLYLKLQSMLFEILVIGNVFCFVQYSKKLKQFTKIIILPPQDCNITNYPLSSESVIVYNQEQIIQLVRRLKSISRDYSGLMMYLQDDLYASELSDVDRNILKNIPEELLQHVFDNEAIVFDSDPYAGGQLGSFAFHMARRKNDYGTLGASLIERAFIPLMQKIHYTYTQWSLASRNMTPRHKLTAPEINPEQLQELRGQFDMSMSMHQYSIVTNYDWNWQVIGADNRLIDLGREYETIQNQIFAGLGVTRQILTGEGAYSSGHINVEIMNAKFLLIRETFKNVIQKKIFKPIAEENGFYDIDSDGFKQYYYPQLSFERLSIIDNDQNFDKLFNLYQKGSLPINYIYEILNIDPEQATQKLQKDMFTVKDAQFNEMLREVYNRTGDDIAQKSNIVDLILEKLYVGGDKLTMNGGQDDQNDDSNEEQNNDFGMDEPQKTPQQSEQVDNTNEQLDKQIQKHSIQLNNEDFEDFIKTQQLIVDDNDITQFLKDENIVILKNKDIKQFMQKYFLKPSNKDIDVFENLMDTELHPSNKMFENFLELANIQYPSNKDVRDFFKLFFLKPNNTQINQFLKRYGLLKVTNDDIEEYLNENKVIDQQVITDVDINQFLDNQNSQVINNEDINNFELMQQQKFKI